MGISRHIEVQDLTPVVADDEKAVQNTKSERWDGERVHRSNGLAMVSEERQPSLHRVWISRRRMTFSVETGYRSAFSNWDVSERIRKKLHGKKIADRPSDK